jgi:hypothetical protein
MKLVATKLATAVMILALGATAARAHDGFAIGVDRCGFPSVPRFHFGVPRFSFGIDFRAAVHVHRWSYVDERLWVAPVFETITVGVTRCGTPILQRVCVRAGYWTTVRYRVCECGLRIRS